MSADLIFINAKVLTMDEAQPRAEAVAIAAGRILAVGSNSDVITRKGPATKVVDAGGRMLLPGFVESHLHLGLGGSELYDLQLGKVHGFDALRDAFQAYAAANPDLPFLMGQGADYAMIEGGVTRHDLDRIISDRPIAMTSHDHHTIWANTLALQLSDTLNGYETSPGHEVVMGEDGLATGELLEFEAFSRIVALAGRGRLNLGIATGGEPDPKPSQAERDQDKDQFEIGLKHCAKYGITSMVMMDGNRYTLECLRELQDEGRLIARVKVPFHYKPNMDHAQLDRAVEMTTSFNDEWLSSGFVKMFMDGVLDSGTAYMINDYPLIPGHKSVALFPPEVFNPLAAEIDRRGLQIAVHAIGDGAVRTVIDGYEVAQLQNGKRDSRHRIEHIELIDRADVPRLGVLGIVASLQPSHPPGAMDFGMEPTLTNIGAARWPDAYLHKTLKENGAPIAYASDWAVTDVAVMRSVQAAVTRVPFSEDCTDERLSLEETLHAYTAGGAWAAHTDHITGRLVPGLAADLVLLQADPETVPPDQLGAVQVALTICGGRVTYAAEGEAL
ncbi:amidohydrolase [Xinfangfangia sp. D13-10-4-6]|uniref:amidohydrolase n=1 Tax=Pseudogemmobacter hezensis TaxID=2737662 RepID=UPI00155636C5|nr:amidohydrolase [Pseudogemmobacter hezensis]NPD15969.1 amidohydrolase [Pseudogemmobacter hezensis]